MKFKRTVVELSIESIRRDGGTQCRAATSLETVKDYAELYRNKIKLPPLIVYHDDAAYWLADGFHRLEGAIMAGAKKIQADIRKGSLRDAILFAVGANDAHGLRRSNADKRKSVEIMLRDPEWAKWADRKIARRCGVSNTFVGEVRKRLSTADSVSSGKRLFEKDGITAEMDTSEIGKGDNASEEGDSDAGTDNPNTGNPNKEGASEPQQPKPSGDNAVPPGPAKVPNSLPTTSPAGEEPVKPPVIHQPPPPRDNGYKLDTLGSGALSNLKRALDSFGCATGAITFVGSKKMGRTEEIITIIEKEIADLNSENQCIHWMIWIEDQN